MICKNVAQGMSKIGRSTSMVEEDIRYIAFIVEKSISDQMTNLLKILRRKR